MNLHRALSYYSGSTYLTGAGQYIAIVDSNCDTDHAVFNAKKAAGKVKNYGNFTADTASDFHCNAVGGFAAGEYDNTTDGDSIMGVAYEAGLHFSDWKSTTATDETYNSEFFKDATLDAFQYDPIAQNNSWGYGLNVTEAIGYISGLPAYTTDQLLAYTFN